jgi:hypothetical protein
MMICAAWFVVIHGTWSSLGWGQFQYLRMARFTALVAGSWFVETG